jgi:hypothetical protein
MAHSNQLTKSHHEYVPPQAAKDPLAGQGYQEKEYSKQEYPKVLDITDADSKPLTAKDARHESELRAKDAKKKEAAKAAESTK